MTRKFLKVQTAYKVVLCLVFLLLFVNCGKTANNPVIAHRGAWKTHNLPENSIASLKEAITLGCYGSEFDVHLTKDNIPVVNHDKDFMGIDIETSTYDELMMGQLSNGEKIPTLKGYMEEGLNQKKTKLILEIKSAPSGKERTLDLTRIAVDMVHNLKGQSLVEYICFDYDAGQLVSQLDPEAEVAYLNGDKTPAQVKEVGYSGIDYNYKVYQKNPTWIMEALDLGLTVNVWTVNKKENMNDFLRQKVDYLTTNEPELLFRILDEK